MKKLEKLLAEGDAEAPKKHYVNMNLNSNITDQASGSGVPAAEAQERAEGRGGPRLGASDSLPALSS